MKDNAVIEEIRETRRKISERFGHDPKRLVEHYMEMQAEHNKLQPSTTLHAPSEKN